MTFSDRYLQSLKPKEKMYQIRESHGFGLRVLPSGVKIFIYVYTLDGKRRQMNLGHYPHKSLADARKTYRDAANLVADGLDPQGAQPTPEPPPEHSTVSALAEVWLNEWSSVHHTSRVNYNYRKALEASVIPLWESRLVNEIKRRDVVALLETIAKKTPGQAGNVMKAARGMFTYAVERELIEFNPFAEVKVARAIPSMVLTSRDRVLNPDEIKHIWQAIDAGGGSDATKRALKLTLVTAQRPGEVAGMHQNEITVGVGKERCKECRRCGWWTIPAERMKNNKEHRVFLSTLAMELIGDAKGYICPSTDNDGPLTANSVAYHVRREVPGTGKEKFYGLSRWTPHDLRRTAGTIINELGSGNEIMDAILSHTLPGVTGIYNRNKYDKEKQVWLTKWSEHLRKLAEGK
ncbi:tyrosine-type recombinase/integrase [Geobacter anodireducens]|uniref:Integrase arm-type DNA-binding domain-containing protein n=1 Tax=Geobacter anodireducens TaxID=1340425 RepID=A0ABR9NZK8_9BACT|nr:site-specific integrase [Geobacter anodireducens]MBE2889662.1 integrase arm-type DNA-binding domain-containing protein [Geobacter anodireducens]